LAAAYNNRGILKYEKLNDSPAERLRQRAAAITDFRTAAKLARAQGQTQYLQQSLEALRILGATENP
jgi:hypothetical protein